MLRALLPAVRSLWIGDRLPGLARLSIASFLAHGHAFELYAYQDVEDVPEGVVLLPADEILPADTIFSYPSEGRRSVGVAFSNVFRYALLHARGGWWVDLDVVCLRPFDFAAALVLAEQPGSADQRVGSHVLRLPQGHALAKICLERSLARDRKTLSWADLGPRLLTAVVTELGLEHAVRPSALFAPVGWRDWRYALDEDVDPGDIAGSHALHLYAEMWRRKGAPLAGPWPARSLVERLRLRHGVALR
jgi:hypothetical protein